MPVPLRASAYDGIGNRTSSTDNLGTTTYNAGSDDNGSANPALNQYHEIVFPGSLTIDPAYDADGNMTSGRVPGDLTAASALVWDAENRLVSATVDGATITYAYDHLSRLISATTAGTTVRYLYDGWNRVAEYNGTTQIAAYLWGLDLSGTPQGAGGVGGLLAISVVASGTVTDTFHAAYDGNGNVSEYVDASGAEVAHFEYDPFGNLTVDAEGNAASFAYRFSTKPQDAVTGLYYYGYRYYDPLTGRWPSRDPLGDNVFFEAYSKDKGLEEVRRLQSIAIGNLYSFLQNDPISLVDVLGLEDCDKCCTCKAEIYFAGHMAGHIACKETDFWYHFGPDIDDMWGWPVLSPGLWMKEKPGIVGVRTAVLCLSEEEAKQIEKFVDEKVFKQPDDYSICYFGKQCWDASTLPIWKTIGALEYSKRATKCQLNLQ